MNKTELSSYLSLTKGKSLLVDLDESRAYPGFVRRVYIKKGNIVSVEFEQIGYDEGGAYFSAKFDSLDSAVTSVESFLGKSIDKWEAIDEYNFEQKFFSNPKLGHDALSNDIKLRNVKLPAGANFELKGSYWKRFEDN